MSENQTMRPLDPTLADSFGLPKWLTENLKLIVGAMVAAVVIAGGISAYKWQAQRSARQAANDLGAILTQKKGKDRLDALTAFTASAPESVRLNALFSLADVAMAAKDWDAAAAAYARIESSAGPALAVPAALGRAGALLEAGKAREALDVLAALKGKAPASFQDIIVLQTVAAAEAAGDTQAALSAYEALQAGETTPNPYYQHQIARLKAQLGEPKS